MNLRRVVLTVTTAAAMIFALSVTGCAQENKSDPKGQPLALVYRGSASCDGCSEAVAAILRASKYHFQVKYIGPRENLKLTAANLAGATLYAQPGGGDDVGSAAASIGESGLAAVRAWVRSGGHYLGFCMGAYLAGSSGFGIIQGEVDSAVNRSGSLVFEPDDTVTPVVWRGKKRWMYFQDGAVLPAAGTSGFSSLATYPNKDIAAAVYSFGQGRVGLVGPHPEADQRWYDNYDLKDPDGIDADLAQDLLNATMTKH